MSEWLIDTLIATTVLMGAVLLIRGQVARFFGPNIAYALWLIPTARLFMPIVTKEVVVAAPEPALVPLAGVNLVDLPMIASTAAGTTWNIDWAMALLTLWVGGAALFFVCKFAAYLQFRQDILSDAVAVDRIGSVRIIESAGVDGPIAFGIIDRHVALPQNFARAYSKPEQELALAHELSHHRAGDLLANLMGLIILSLHWFNPIAWAAWSAFRFDQEAACDARVLKQQGPRYRGAYGRAIAKSATGQSFAGETLGFVSPLNPKEKIIQRLKILSMTEKSKLRRSLGLLFVGGSTAAAAMLTATVSYAVVETPQSVSPKNVSVVKAVPLPPSKPAKAGAAHDPDTVVQFGENMTIAVKDKKKNKTVNITMLGDDDSGESYVRRIRQADGTTVVLRTNRKLGDKEAAEMVREAQQSRREADAELRRHRIELQNEQREAEREARAEAREAQHEAREAQQEAWADRAEAHQEAAEAAREARAEWREQHREAARKARKHWETKHKKKRKKGQQSTSFVTPPMPPMPVEPWAVKMKSNGWTGENMNFQFETAGCDGKGKNESVVISSIDKNGKKTNRRTVKCSDMVIPAENIIESLKYARLAIADMPALSKKERAEALKELDREMRRMKKELRRSR